MKTKLKYIILIVTIAIIGTYKINASEINLREGNTSAIQYNTNVVNLYFYQSSASLFTFNVKNDYNNESPDYIWIPFYFTTGTKVEESGKLMLTCNEWKPGPNGSYICTDAYDNQGTYSNNLGINFSAEIVYNNGNISSCEISSNYLKCPYNIIHKNTKVTQIKIHSKTTSATNTIYLGQVIRTFFVNDLTGAINNQTNTINNTLTQDKEYNKNPSENIEGKQELDNMDNKEEQLFNKLDFSGINATAISINPNTSSFIWSIANRLRGMNEYIILIITSVLGIGIIKMVLNR